MDDTLKSLGDYRLHFIREAIAEKIERELAAPTQTKTETTELETDQVKQPDNSQTTQAAQEPETNPTPAEQATTPKTQRKERQTPARKQAKPKTQSRSQKSSATEN
jgi:hypothetical protein